MWQSITGSCSTNQIAVVSLSSPLSSLLYPSMDIQLPDKLSLQSPTFFRIYQEEILNAASLKKEDLEDNTKLDPLLERVRSKRGEDLYHVLFG